MGLKKTTLCCICFPLSLGLIVTAVVGALALFVVYPNYTSSTEDELNEQSKKTIQDVSYFHAQTYSSLIQMPILDLWLARTLIIHYQEGKLRTTTDFSSAYNARRISGSALSAGYVELYENPHDIELSAYQLSYAFDPYDLDGWNTTKYGQGTWEYASWFYGIENGYETDL